MQEILLLLVFGREKEWRGEEENMKENHGGEGERRRKRRENIFCLEEKKYKKGKYWERDNILCGGEVRNYLQKKNIFLFG